MSAEEAFASIHGVEHLVLGGKPLSADIAKLVTGASVSHTIEGAPTLEITLDDPRRKLLRSGLLSKHVAMRIDGYSYQLVHVGKSSATLNLTFEHSVSVALRSHDSIIKAAPFTTNHVQFAHRLVNEVGWVEFHAPQGAASPVKVEISRGVPESDDSSSAKKTKWTKEDTWTALGRYCDDRGWRRYVRGTNELWYVPETYLFTRTPAYTLSENTRGVDNIDFEFDTGQKVAEMTVTARASRWFAPVGQTVNVHDMGPVNGKWLVTQIERDIFSLNVTITLKKPQPTLPEPEPDQSTMTANAKKEAAAKSAGGILNIGTAISNIAQTVVDAATGGHSIAGHSYTNRADDFVSVALSQKGKQYIFGTEVSPKNKDPRAFDCSELVEWATAQCGVKFPDGTVGGLAWCKKKHTTIPVDKARYIRGALLYRMGGTYNHVALPI
jgi:cell wall-associated NlpC family hydrolase